MKNPATFSCAASDIGAGALSRLSGFLGLSFVAQNAETALGSLAIYAWKEVFDGAIETGMTRGVELAVRGVGLLMGAG